MNTNRPRQLRAATLTTIVAFIAWASSGAPAFAREPHGDGQGTSATLSVSPYALPITTLDGLTLAQYLQNHQAGDPRTTAVV